MVEVKEGILGRGALGEAADEGVEVVGGGVGEVVVEEEKGVGEAAGGRDGGEAEQGGGDAGEVAEEAGGEDDGVDLAELSVGVAALKES